MSTCSKLSYFVYKYPRTTSTSSGDECCYLASGRFYTSRTKAKSIKHITKTVKLVNAGDTDIQDQVKVSFVASRRNEEPMLRSIRGSY